MIPVCYTMVLIIYVMPFTGSGPIFAKIMDDFFRESCGTYWWTNLILINNFYPWSVNLKCGAHLAQIANEFQLIVLLIPVLAYFYHNFNSKRKILYTIFTVIGLMSMAAVVTVTIKYKVDGYPGFISEAYSDMYTKLYYRLPPMLIGIALAQLHFEYKCVKNLTDGSLPYSKILVNKIDNKKTLFKFLSYSVGFIFCLIPILLLKANSSCIADNLKSSYVIYNFELKFCWGPVGTSIYYALSPILFYGGVVLILLPSILGMSTILKGLLNSHLWHILEELTFFAYLL
jgi:hypothetical protein